MEPFNPIKRIEPARQDRDRGSRAPLLNIPQNPQGNPIDAFAKLLGIGVDVFNQWSEQQEEEQLKAAAELVAQKEDELKPLYKEYADAEKRGEIPKGYSPFMFRAVRRNIGGRMARQVQRELDTTVMEQIVKGEHIDADFEDVYDLAVEEVLQDRIGAGLADVDTEFLVAFDSEAQKYKDSWLSQAYKKNGEVRLDAAKEEFEAGLTEWVQRDWTPKEFQDSMMRYKKAWRDNGGLSFEPGFMEEAIVRTVARHADNLIDAAVTALGTNQEDEEVDRLIEEARKFIELAGEASTTPYSEKPDHNLRARNADIFEKMDDKLDKLVITKFEKEGQGQRLSSIQTALTRSTDNTITGLVALYPGVFNPETGEFDRQHEHWEKFEKALAALKTVRDPNNDIDDIAWRGIWEGSLQDYARQSSNDYGTRLDESKTRAVESESSNILKRLLEKTSAKDRLTEIKAIEEGLARRRDSGEMDQIVWAIVHTDLSNRRKEHLEVINKAAKELDAAWSSEAVFTLDLARFTALAGGRFEEANIAEMYSFYNGWLEDRRASEALAVVHNLDYDSLTDLQALRSSEAYATARDRYKGEGESALFEAWLQDTDHADYLATATAVSQDFAVPGGAAARVSEGADIVESMPTDFEDEHLVYATGGKFKNGSAKKVNKLSEEVDELLAGLTAVGDDDRKSVADLSKQARRVKELGAHLAQMLGKDVAYIRTDGTLHVSNSADFRGHISTFNIYEYFEEYNKRVVMVNNFLEAPLAKPGTIRWSEGWAIGPDNEAVGIEYIDYRSTPLIPAFDTATGEYSERILDDYLKDFISVKSLTGPEVKETRLYKLWKSLPESVLQGASFNDFAVIQFQLYSRFLSMTPQDSLDDTQELPTPENTRKPVKPSDTK